MNHPIVSFEELLTPEDVAYLKKLHICLHARKRPILEQIKVVRPHIAYVDARRNSVYTNPK
jgi:hypothetical protein